MVHLAAVSSKASKSLSHSSALTDAGNFVGEDQVMIKVATIPADALAGTADRLTSALCLHEDRCWAFPN
jgi:hypothetical protein